MNEGNNKAAGAAPLRTTKKKKGIMPVILVLIYSAVLIVAAVVVISLMNSGGRATKTIEQGDRYFSQQDYEQALAQWKKAVEMDPENSEIIEAADRNVRAVIDAAIAADQAGDYDEADRILDLVLANKSGAFKQETVALATQQKEKVAVHRAVHGILEQATADYEAGRYQEAMAGYTEALSKGAEDADVQPRLDLCGVCLNMFDLANAGSYEELAAFLDSQEAASLVTELDSSSPIFFAGDSGIVAGRDGDAVYAICGGLSESVTDGQAIAVISSTNTYAIYEGDWKSLKPDGNGTLSIWNKNESLADAMVLSGTPVQGVFDGTVTYSDPTLSDIPLQMESGALKVLSVNADGQVEVSEGYEALNTSGSGDVVADYVGGVPGFGGNDVKLVLERLDNEPPVFSTDLKMASYGNNSYGPYVDGYYYERADIIGLGITATDNIDGDVTDKIEYTETKGPSVSGDQNQWEYSMVVVYTVTDTAGNTASLTVKYEKQDFCDEPIWYVVSIDNE